MSENSQTPDPGAVKRPQAAQVRRRRAVELLARGGCRAEVAELLGVSQDRVRRWQVRVRTGGVEALRWRRASGQPAKLADAQVEQVRDALVAGATAHGCDTDLWTLDRVAQVVEQVTAVHLSSPASVGRLLGHRLGWSVQRPERQARERDEEAIRRSVQHAWPRINKGQPSGVAGLCFGTSPASACSR